MRHIGYMLDDGNCICNRCAELEPNNTHAILTQENAGNEACCYCKTFIAWPKLTPRPSFKFDPVEDILLM